MKKGAWLASWGERPSSSTKIEKIFSDWYSKAPKLIPIHAHRFVVSIPSEITNPVLSVWGTDTIVYGWNMKHYLMEELKHYLDLYEPVYKADIEKWSSQPVKELSKFHLMEEKE